MRNARSPAAWAVAVAAAAVTFAATLDAQATEPAAAATLRDAMQQMGRDLQAVTGAISSEDWTGVADLAPKIARHAEPPPSEKIRILAWLGTDAAKFRRFDGRVRETATAMGEAATRRDGHAVIAAFAELQKTCLDCHQGFREAFVEHFHAER